MDNNQPVAWGHDVLGGPRRTSCDIVMQHKLCCHRKNYLGVVFWRIEHLTQSLDLNLSGWDNWMTEVFLYRGFQINFVKSWSNYMVKQRSFCILITWLSWFHNLWIPNYWIMSQQFILYNTVLVQSSCLQLIVILQLLDARDDSNLEYIIRIQT